MSRITQQPFGAPAYPKRIEDDPMFNGWDRALPRLWYLDQRQATRLDAESLFGSSQYAVFYSRAVFTTLAEPLQTPAIGVYGYHMPTITDIGVPAQTPSRDVDYIRTVVTELDEPEQDSIPLRPSGGPVNPIVHPITGAPIGEGQAPYEGDIYVTQTLTLGYPEEGDVSLWTVSLGEDQYLLLTGVRAKRIGGSGISLNASIEDSPLLAVDLSLPIEDVWLGYSANELAYENEIHNGDEIVLHITGVSGDVGQLVVEVEFQVYETDPDPGPEIGDGEMEHWTFSNWQSFVISDNPHAYGITYGDEIMSLSLGPDGPTDLTISGISGFNWFGMDPFIVNGHMIDAYVDEDGAVCVASISLPDMTVVDTLETGGANDADYLYDADRGVMFVIAQHPDEGSILIAVDVSDPESLTEVGTLPFGEEDFVLDGHGMMMIVGDVLIGISESFYIWTFDISDYEEMSVLSAGVHTIDGGEDLIPWEAGGVIGSKAIYYTSGWDEDLEIYRTRFVVVDYADPSSPVSGSVLSTHAEEIFIEDSLLRTYVRVAGTREAYVSDDKIYYIGSSSGPPWMAVDVAIDVSDLDNLNLSIAGTVEYPALSTALPVQIFRHQGKTFALFGGVFVVSEDLPLTWPTAPDLLMWNDLDPLAILTDTGYQVGGPSAGASHLPVRDDVAYTRLSDGFARIDISPEAIAEPENILEIDRFEELNTGSAVSDIAVDGNGVVYLLNYHFGEPDDEIVLTAVDGESKEVLGDLVVTTGNFNTSYNIEFVVPYWVYVAVPEENSIYVIDVSDPEDMSIQDTITDATALSQVTHVWEYARRGYIYAWSNEEAYITRIRVDGLEPVIEYTYDLAEINSDIDRVLAVRRHEFDQYLWISCLAILDQYIACLTDDGSQFLDNFAIATGDEFPNYIATLEVDPVVGRLAAFHRGACSAVDTTVFDTNDAFDGGTLPVLNTGVDMTTDLFFASVDLGDHIAAIGSHFALYEKYRNVPTINLSLPFEIDWTDSEESLGEEWDEAGYELVPGHGVRPHLSGEGGVAYAIAPGDEFEAGQSHSMFMCIDCDDLQEGQGFAFYWSLQSEDGSGGPGMFITFESPFWTASVDTGTGVVTTDSLFEMLPDPPNGKVFFAFTFDSDQYALYLISEQAAYVGGGTSTTGQNLNSMNYNTGIVRADGLDDDGVTFAGIGLYREALSEGQVLAIAATFGCAPPQ